MRGLVKQPVDPTRLRHLPRQFGAIDRNLVYQGHLQQLGLAEIALYALLLCVSDPQGLSYYSDRRLGELLGLESEALKRARHGLVQQRMLLYRAPFYQLLDLPEAP